MHEFAALINAASRQQSRDRRSNRFRLIPDQSTFAVEAGKLADEGHREEVKEAAIHAVFASFRNGVELPEEVRAAYKLNKSEAISVPAVEATYHHELMEWVEFVLDAILDPLTFNRDSNQSYTAEQAIGLIALGALSNSPTAGYVASRWRFDPGEIPTPEHVRELIRELEVDAITDMFTQVNRAFIQCTSQLGFFDTEYDYAVNTTWIDWGRDSEDWMEIITSIRRGGV